VATEGPAERVDVHDISDNEVPRPSPPGCSTWVPTRGWMSVGDDHDTAAFAVNAIRR